MEWANIILILILLVTTLIDLIPIFYKSKLSDYQKYAYVFYIIAVITLILNGEGVSAVFWGINAILSFFYGGGDNHGLYFVLLGILCVVWILYVFLFGNSA